MATQHTFSYVVEKSGDWDRFYVRGPITEEAKPLLVKMSTDGGDKCILDMRDVTFINSCGIRDWSYALKDMREAKTVVFEFVPDEVVRTMNMVLSFRQGLPVRSLMRVYECTSCDHVMTVTLTEGKDYAEQKIPQIGSLKCETCGSLSEPLDTDEEFFLFMVNVA